MLKRAVLAAALRLLRQRDFSRELDRQFLLRHRHLPPTDNLPAPYEDLAAASVAAVPPQRSALFISSRFRSGSTLLWNIFRQLDGCTSYYEPFNERRWFDRAQRGSRVDATHRGVVDYWREYDGLESLGRWYREEWVREGLYMDARSHAPEMQRFIEQLIDSADGVAVLQFNRVDFRLPWLRHQFPEVPLVHLYRHPREQWLSVLAEDQRSGPEDLEAAFLDRFYLNSWCRDLARHFPFLDPRETPQPYRRFYYLWKLSWLFGSRYAHASIAFEDLVTEPQKTLEGVLTAVGWKGPVDWTRLLATIEAPEPGRWRRYAPEQWFLDHEAFCEATLARALGAAADGEAGAPARGRAPLQ